jgi:hypothetical protein
LCAWHENTLEREHNKAHECPGYHPPLDSQARPHILHCETTRIQQSPSNRLPFTHLEPWVCLDITSPVLQAPQPLDGLALQQAADQVPGLRAHVGGVADGPALVHNAAHHLVGRSEREGCHTVSTSVKDVGQKRCHRVGIIDVVHHLGGRAGREKGVIGYRR